MIAVEDRVTYAEAQQITGYSRSQLNWWAAAGQLRRDGGTRGDRFSTWLSRAECEELSLQRYRWNMAGGYWLTRIQAAELLGLSRGYAYRLPFPLFEAAQGDQLLRRADVEEFAERRRVWKAKAQVWHRRSDQRPQ